MRFAPAATIAQQSAETPMVITAPSSTTAIQGPETLSHTTPSTTSNTPLPRTNTNTPVLQVGQCKENQILPLTTMKTKTPTPMTTPTVTLQNMTT
jgi:hypothetical protein